MEKLTICELKKVHGANNGVFYFEGKGYEFSCPNVSKECLDSYLSFIEKLPPGKYPKPKTLNDVLIACGGFAGASAIEPCIDSVREQVMNDLS
jgi:hypothetical protein